MVLAYKQSELTAEKYLERLLDALRLTVPMLDKIDIAKWPFNENEMDILSDIGNAYHRARKRDEEFNFLLKYDYYNIRIKACNVQNRKTKFYDSARYKRLALMYTETAPSTWFETDDWIYWN